MARTGAQVREDVYQLLRNSTLCSMISGDAYMKMDYRPRDSRLEDAVVMSATGLPDQIQTGEVTVNIYVPDFDPYDNGVLVEDGERTREVERLAQAWVNSLSAVVDYDFELLQTIYTEEEEEIHQHFVVVKLGYRCFDDEEDTEDTDV